MARMNRRIAYVSSRFPVLREAFIIREVLALERAGLDVRVFSLKHPHTHTGNRDFESLEGTVYWTPHLLHGRLLRDNFVTFLKAPLAYVGTPLRNAFRFRRYPLQALKVLGLFPKMVHYSREMQRQGCVGMNACWANFPTLLATVARRFFGIPYSMTCRAWDIFVPMNQVDLPPKIAAATIVRANNDNGARYVEQFCPSVEDKAKIRRVYNPFDVAALEPRKEPPTGPLRIVAGGSLVEQKGLTYLLDALAALAQRGIACRTEIVGEGPLLEELRAQCARLGIEDCVEFTGGIPNHVLMQKMLDSNAFVLPSVPATTGEMDGIPNVLIESMSLGVPVVSTSISGIPELVEDGSCGLLVPPRDAQKLAAALQRLLGDRDLQRSFAANGRIKVESMFEMSRNARQLIAIYEDAGLLSRS